MAVAVDEGFVVLRTQVLRAEVGSIMAGLLEISALYLEIKNLMWLENEGAYLEEDVDF